MIQHAARLNATQSLAVAVASSFRISAIRGPPGTGKTATIATIAMAALACGQRSLLLAPSNAATLRMLESLLAAGAQDVGIVVATVREREKEREKVCVCGVYVCYAEACLSAADDL